MSMLQKEGRKRRRDCSRVLRSLLMFGACLGPCWAQYEGAWGLPFNHQVGPFPSATDPGFEPGGLAAMVSAGLFYNISGFALGWPAAAGNQPCSVGSGLGPSFEAIHMSLIPKGPNRGKLLVGTNCLS